MPKALNVIKDEHRSLGAIMHGFLFLVDEIRAGRMQPDFKLLNAMLYYLENFPEKLHHPKENEFLHRYLRLRSPEANALLEVVEEEHRHSHAQSQVMIEALRNYEQNGDAARDAFLDAVKSYAEFQWRHIEREEDLILPLAVKVLQPEDWAAIDEAFSAHQDPFTSYEHIKEFRQLFREIVRLAPPPIGVGPANTG
ncbi:MAG: hemerythrin domain-containing protein [Rhodocyclales bacterium]|nr:hemerythrin domain-containing protein [Rhodocyclales bacterium]